MDRCPQRSHSCCPGAPYAAASSASNALDSRAPAQVPCGAQSQTALALAQGPPPALSRGDRSPSDPVGSGHGSHTSGSGSGSASTPHHACRVPTLFSLCFIASMARPGPAPYFMYTPPPGPDAVSLPAHDHVPTCTTTITCLSVSSPSPLPWPPAAAVSSHDAT